MCSMLSEVPDPNMTKKWKRMGSKRKKLQFSPVDYETTLNQIMLGKLGFLWMMQGKCHDSLRSLRHINPSSAVATFAQNTRMQRFFKTIKTLSCWYSLESSCWALSDEYPFAKGFNVFSGFLHNFVLANLAISSIRVKSMGYCLI